MKEQSTRTFVVVLAAFLLLVPLSFTSIKPARAATASEGIIIPLYTYPGSTWDTVAQTKSAHPNVPIVAIVNPSNGPGFSYDSNYASGIAKLRAAGVTVIGYVSTSYTSRSLSAVEADVNTWTSWYPNINGIFFDEQSNTAGGESYYSQASSYAYSKGLTFTVGNPGANTIPTYLSTVNVVLIYESPGLPDLSSYNSWTGYDKSKLGMIPFGVSPFSSSWTQSAEQTVGWIYVTNDVLPNPWDSVTPYLGTLASMFDSSPPASTSTTSHSLTVTSLDQNGNAANGMWTQIQQNGVTVSTGYTPLKVSLTSGTYSVTVANYNQLIFSHWQDGSTSSTKSVNLNSDTSLTAYYNNGQLPVSHSLTVTSLDQNGNAANGMWTQIQQNGVTVSTGYTPLKVSLTSGTYSVTVANYNQLIFSHWQDGSTSSTKSVNLNSDTSLTAYYNNGQISTKTTISVPTTDLSGNAITGYYTTLYDSSGTMLQSQYSPASFTVDSGKTYTVQVADYGQYTFAHWQDGSTSRTITVNTSTAPTSLHAYYKTAQVNLSVNSVGLTGNAITGMFTTLTDSSGHASTGFTPTSFTVNTGSSYTVTVADYLNTKFSHWDNGSTDRTRTVNPTTDTTLVAYYTQ